MDEGRITLTSIPLPVPVLFLRIGVTFCLISGGNDLSVGTGMICYALAGGYLVQHLGWPVWGGMLVTISIGLVFGVLNGVLVAIMNLPPFIATLCTMLITRGLGSILTGGMAVSWPSRSGAGGWFRSLFKIIDSGKIIPVGFIIVLFFIKDRKNNIIYVQEREYRELRKKGIDPETAAAEPVEKTKIIKSKGAVAEKVYKSEAEKKKDADERAAKKAKAKAAKEAAEKAKADAERAAAEAERAAAEAEEFDDDLEDIGDDVTETAEEAAEEAAEAAEEAAEEAAKDDSKPNDGKNKKKK